MIDLTHGHKSTEGKRSKWVVISSLLISILGIVAEFALQEWLEPGSGIAVSIAGMVVSAAESFGYKKETTRLKIAKLQADAIKKSRVSSGEG